MKSEKDNSMTGSSITDGDTWVRGKDIWLRARTNALAHEIASRSLKRVGDYIFIAQTIFIVISIILISVSLQITTARLQSETPSAPGNPQTEQTSSLRSMDYRLLSVISIISNGIALLLGFLSNRFRWVERSLKHDELLAMYGLIAQKARRLEDRWMDVQEAKQYCGNLQDLFETAKNRGLEASPKNFEKAKEVMTGFNAYPFGLTADQVRGKSA